MPDADREHARAAGNSVHDRTEPSWVEPPTSPYADTSINPAHSTPSASDAADIARVSPQRKILRGMLMAGIFIVGAGAGLIGAWWIDQPTGMSFIRSSGKAPVKPVVAVRKTVDDGRSNTVRGINPSELPYDGAAPPSQDGQATSAQEAANEPAPPTAVVDSPSPARNLQPGAMAQSSGASSVKEGSASSDGDESKAEGGISDATTPEDASRETEREARKQASHVDTQPAKPIAKAASRIREGEASKVSAAPKRAMPAKSGKDREIERIKQQAEDELKKKSERGRQVNRSRSIDGIAAKSQSLQSLQSPQFRGKASSSSRRPNEHTVRATLARCERASNFILREQCKWRICGGAWGKNGCPYYPPHVSNAY